jgi:hypothetical protein
MTTPGIALAQLDSSRDTASVNQASRVLAYQQKHQVTPDWEQGEPVRVLDVNGAKMCGPVYPAGGWRGTVIRVGRKLAGVEYLGPHGRPVFRDFRKDTGVVNDKYGHLKIRREYVARATERRGAAVKALSGYGLLVTCQDPSAPGALDVSLLEALVRVLDANAGRSDREVP